jgi:hypothetical protein
MNRSFIGDYTTRAPRTFKTARAGADVSALQFAYYRFLNRFSIEILDNTASTAVGANAGQFSANIRAEFAKWRKVSKET